MSENICIKCHEEFENSYFDKEQKKCILHCYKTNSFSREKTSHFNNELTRYIEMKKNKNCYIFDSIEFPNLMNKDYESPFIDLKSTDKPIYFTNCKFFSSVFFLDFNLRNRLSFSRCIFYKNVNFEESVFKKSVSILECEFINSKLEFNNVKFNKSFNFGVNNLSSFTIRGCTFDEKIDFFANKNYLDFKIESTLFNNDSILNIINIKFKKLEFIQVINLSNQFSISNVDIYEKMIIKHTNLSNVKFYLINLENAIFEISSSSFYNATFVDIKWGELNKNKFISNKSNRDTFVQFKSIYEQQNNIIEANKFYALEMNEREKELIKDRESKKNFFEWIVFKIHGMSSNYSQDWVLPILWILIFGLLNSFYQFLILEDTNKNLVHFSNDLFLGVLVFSFLCFYIYIILESRKFNIYLSLLSFISVLYIFYGWITNDFYLTFFAINTNPFSIMKNGEQLTFIGLLFKIIIAYLIYQLIISIRQNTRRK